MLEKTPVINAPKKPSFTWTFALGGNAKTGTYWTVNGKPFDPKRVDVEVPLGSTQTWRLRNVSPITHYIHLHEEEWHTISRDGRKPPPWEQGLEDTWRLDPGETVVVAARFTDYTGVFMVHCHMLDHEDDGMMAQFAVVAPPISAGGRAPGTTLPAGYYEASTVVAAPAAPAHEMSMSHVDADEHVHARHGPAGRRLAVVQPPRPLGRSRRRRAGGGGGAGRREPLPAPAGAFGHQFSTDRVRILAMSSSSGVRGQVESSRCCFMVPGTRAATSASV